MTATKNVLILVAIFTPNCYPRFSHITSEPIPISYVHKLIVELSNL